MIVCEMDTDGKALANYLKVTKQEDTPKAFAGYVALIGMGAPTALLNIIRCAVFGSRDIDVSKRTHERLRLLATDNYEVIYHMIRAKQWRWRSAVRFYSMRIIIGSLVACVAVGTIVSGIWSGIRG